MNALRDTARLYGPVALSTAAIVAFFVAVAVNSRIGVFAEPLGKLFIGPDSWTRAYRALELRFEGGWFSDTLQRVGLDGISQHWSRPVDALNIAMAELFGLITGGFRSGLEAWATWSGPLQILPLVAILAWAVHPLVTRRPRMAFALAVLLPLQLYLWGYFFPGRIDWHPQNFMATAGALGLLVRAVPGGVGHVGRPAVLGAGLGLLLWAAPEALIPLAGVLSFLGVAWALTGDRGTLTGCRKVGGWLALSVAVGVVLEQGPDVLAIHYDEPSLFHAVLFCLNAAFWGTAGYVTSVREDAGWWLRFLVGGVFGAMAIGFVLWFYPGLIEGRINADIDRTYVRMRAIHIMESQLLFRPSMVWEEGLGTLVRSLAEIGVIWVAVFAAPILAWRDRARRWLWVGLSLLIAGFTGGDFVIRNRSAPLLILFSLPVAAFVLAGLFDRIAALASSCARSASGVPAAGHRAAAGRPVVIGIVVAALALPAFLAVQDRGDATTTPTAETSSREPRAANASPPQSGAWEGFRASAAVLSREPAGVVATYADFGPELLYRTEHRVLSIPTHRDQPGFRGLHFAMVAKSMPEARRRLTELGATHLLIIEADTMRGFFGLKPAQGDTVGKRLVAGDLPDWAARLQVSGVPDDASVHLFRVES